MPCGGCSKRSAAVRAARAKTGADYDVLGGFKTLPARQLNARLEVYKKMNCTDCDNRYKCDYPMYVNCKGK